jgi:polyhydroxybutyrate depolymerase
MNVTPALAAAVVTVGLLAGCSSGTSHPVVLQSGTPGATTATTATSTAAAPAAGCGGATTATASPTVTIDGRSRVVIVHLPPNYDGSKQLPLVLNMHGSGVTAVDQEEFSGMDATADDDDFIVAYPQGLLPDSTGFDWNVPGVPLVGGKAVPAGSADDVSFLTQLVGVLENRYCIDPHRVYATGFSGGARMASQLACDASTVFAAVAPVSGLRDPNPCHPTRDVPIISFHGTADPVDPYAGHGEAYWAYSVPQAALDWARQQGCASTATTSHPAASVTLSSYTGCSGGSAVELYSISGEGHEWPGGPTMPRVLVRVLGSQSTAIDANAVMWAFFQARSLP